MYVASSSGTFSKLNNNNLSINRPCIVNIFVFSVLAENYINTYHDQTEKLVYLLARARPFPEKISSNDDYNCLTPEFICIKKSRI